MEITGYTNTAEIVQKENELKSICSDLKITSISIIMKNYVCEIGCFFPQKGNMNIRHKLLAKGWHEAYRKRRGGCVYIHMTYDMQSDNIEYVLVSQGVVIYRTPDKKEAFSMMCKSNKEWREYRMRCIEAGERPADNEVFMFEEKMINGVLETIEIKEI